MIHMLIIALGSGAVIGVLAAVAVMLQSGG